MWYSNWGSKMSEEIHLSAFFDTGGVVVRQEIFVIPCSHAYLRDESIRPDFCSVYAGMLEILDAI